MQLGFGFASPVPSPAPVALTPEPAPVEPAPVEPAPAEVDTPGLRERALFLDYNRHCDSEPLRAKWAERWAKDPDRFQMHQHTPADRLPYPLLLEFMAFMEPQYRAAQSSSSQVSSSSSSSSSASS